MQARRYDEAALQVSIAHPKKPAEVLRRMLQAARRAWGAGRGEVWKDPMRFRQWLAARGVPTRSRREE